MCNEYNLFIRFEEVFQFIVVDFFKWEVFKIIGKFMYNVYIYCFLNGNYNNIIIQVSKNVLGKYVFFRCLYNFVCLLIMYVYMVRVVFIYIFVFNFIILYILI